MSTFHNFSQCIYTTQGKVVCNAGEKSKKTPMLLESFVDQIPNQKDTDCTSLSKTFNDVISNYPACNTTTQKDKGSCTFTFKCTDST